MSTIYILQPDDEARKDAIDHLLDSLDKLYPDELISRHALAVTTDRPEVLAILTSLANPSQATLPEAGAPASSPAKKARRQPRAPKGIKDPKPAKSGSLLDIAARKKGEKEPGDSGAPASQPESIPAGDPPMDPGRTETGVKESQSQEAAGRKKSAGLKPLAWTVLKNGKKLTDPYYLLRTGKLAIGDRLSHEKRGLYEVADVAGLLTLKRIAS